MENRIPSLRIALRRARREARRERDREKVALITRALSDRDILDETIVRVLAQNAGREEMREEALGDGSFLQWLIDNLPAILEIIAAIIAMFG